MTSSLIIRLAITIQPTLRNRSTLDRVNGTAIGQRRLVGRAGDDRPPKDASQSGTGLV